MFFVAGEGIISASRLWREAYRARGIRAQGTVTVETKKSRWTGLGGGRRDEGFGIGVLGFVADGGFLWRAKV